MIQTTDKKKRIILYYEEFKKQFELDVIDIIPQPINKLSMEMAYTDNEELVNCIKKNIPVTFYYNKKLFKCSEKYIKAILYHEFTHIRDCYNFVDYENANFFMSSYSEYNAMRMEFFLRCDEQVVGLDCKVCNERGKTTPKQEIEEYLGYILSVSNVKQVSDFQDKEGIVVNTFAKYISWMFGILSYYEISEPEYFQSCFDRMDDSYRLIAQKLYQEVQDIEKIKDNPKELFSALLDLITVCVMKEGKISDKF